MKKNGIAAILLATALLSYKNTYASHALDGIGALFLVVFFLVMGVFSIISIVSLILSIVYYRKQKKGLQTASIVLTAIFDSLIFGMFLIWLTTADADESDLFTPITFFIIFIGLFITKVILLVKKV